MSIEYNIRVKWKEELVGDEANSDNFYWRIEPMITVAEKSSDPTELKKKAIKAVAEEVLKEIKANKIRIKL